MIYTIGKLKITSEEYKDKIKNLPVLTVFKEIMDLSGCTLKECRELVDKMHLEMYAEKDSIVKEMYLKVIDDIPQCDIGAPSPRIFSDENFVYLFYYIKTKDENWDGTYVNVRNCDDIGVACIKFEYCTQYKFGFPNDEAIEGHPLYKYGLQAYTFSEVINSEWVKTLMQMNRVHYSHKDENFDNCKHYIYFFHDNCFEIVCRSYSYDIMNTNINEAVLHKIGLK